MFLAHQISILEWFLKDRVTLEITANNSVSTLIRIFNFELHFLFASTANSFGMWKSQFGWPYVLWNVLPHNQHSTVSQRKERLWKMAETGKDRKSSSFNRTGPEKTIIKRYLQNRNKVLILRWAWGWRPKLTSKCIIWHYSVFTFAVGSKYQSFVGPRFLLNRPRWAQARLRLTWQRHSESSERICLSFRRRWCLLIRVASLLSRTCTALISLRDITANTDKVLKINSRILSCSKFWWQ